MKRKLLSMALAALAGVAPAAAGRARPPGPSTSEKPDGVIAVARPATPVSPTVAEVRRLPAALAVPGRELAAPEPADDEREERRPSVLSGTPGARPPAARGSVGTSPAPASSFAGAHFDDSGRIPPDAAGAVGPGHLMLAHNGVVQIQDKSTGAVLKKLSLPGFWAPAGYAGQGAPAAFDPRVLFDPRGGRWIASSAADRESLTSSLLVAVSKTTDPTGGWFYYRLDPPGESADAWYDFPLLGFNDDWVVVRAAVPFAEKHTYVLPKAGLYAGARVTPQLLEDREDVLAPCASLDATTGLEYLVGGAGDVYALVSGAEGVALTRRGRAAPPPGSSDWANGSAPLPQLGNSAGILAGNSWPNAATFRNGSVWFAHTVFLPADAPVRAAAQWWEIDPSAPRVLQFGRVDDTSDGTGRRHFAFPALAVNARGDAVLGFSTFSAESYAGAGYAFRLAGDPPGAMRDPALLKAGLGPYEIVRTSGNRWGDYSGAAADPASDDLWVLLEYSATTSENAWGTWWGRVRAGDDLAVSLRAAGQYLRVRDSTSLSPEGPMTAEAWVRRAAGGKGNGVVLSKRGGGGYELRISAKTGRATLLLYDSAGKARAKVTSAASVPADRWAHVAGGYDGTSAFVAVDGEITALPAPGGPADGPADLVIGRAANGTGAFRGAIDDVRLSSVARYAAGSAPQRGFANDTLTLGLWKLDDGAGSTSAVDASGNGNTAAVAGSPAWVPGVTAAAKRAGGD